MSTDLYKFQDAFLLMSIDIYIKIIVVNNKNLRKKVNFFVVYTRVGPKLHAEIHAYIPRQNYHFRVLTAKFYSLTWSKSRFFLAKIGIFTIETLLKQEP